MSGRRSLRIDKAFDGLVSLAGIVADKFEDSGARRVKVGFGCDLVLHSGRLVALVGSAASTTSFSAELEWEAPEPSEGSTQAQSSEEE